MPRMWRNSILIFSSSILIFPCKNVKQITVSGQIRSMDSLKSKIGSYFLFLFLFFTNYLEFIYLFIHNIVWNADLCFRWSCLGSWGSCLTTTRYPGGCLICDPGLIVSINSLETRARNIIYIPCISGLKTSKFSWIHPWIVVKSMFHSGKRIRVLDPRRRGRRRLWIGRSRVC